MSDRRHMGGEQFELRIVAQPSDDAPPIVRLRHALKALLRAYNFRATSVRDVTPGLPPLPAGRGVADGAGGTDDR